MGPGGFQPKIELVDHFKNKTSTTTLAAARTCYSKKLIDMRAARRWASPEEEWEARAKEQLEDLREAGHLTTMKHSAFLFSLQDVSRHFLWSFLHSHPFYNSEQVSQRYVAVKEGNFVIPPMQGAALDEYITMIKKMEAGYFRLQELLVESISGEYYKRFPGHAQHPEKWKTDISKRVLEAARYVLPVATTAFLYHTISGLTLLRYSEMMQQSDTPTETRAVVSAMLEEVRKIDPEFVALAGTIPLEATTEYNVLNAFPRNAGDTEQFKKEFDIGLEGKVSKMTSWQMGAEETLASAVREVFGLPKARVSDDDAIDLVLNPAKNAYLGNMLDVHTLSKLDHALETVTYGFMKKLSHTADSQDQRHRTIAGPRGIVDAQLSKEPDCIWPTIFYQNPKIMEFAESLAREAWDTMHSLQAKGVPAEFAQYVLPNATTVRLRESGSLLNLMLKFGKRLCYTAQEEIWRASLAEAKQIADLHPRIGKHFFAPCELREQAGTKPACPEGKRYCGIPVWRFKGLEDYQRVI